ncbi:PAS domain-containing sensor histidine kinase, partial [Escherichia coli]
AWRRWSLWTALVLLVAGMLVTQVWLAGRYEATEVQNRLERDAADAVADLRTGFTHNLQNLQALQAGDPDIATWEERSARLLGIRRELVRVEWRDPSLRVRAHAETPYRPVQWDADARGSAHSNTALA